MRGSINPYFGVYKEPIYRTIVALTPIPRGRLAQGDRQHRTRAGFITQLLLNEMPDDIEAAFDCVKLHLLPHSRREFLTSCSCPDDANPCKHVAGVSYTLAAALDRDPLVLFELRGLSRAQLRSELEASPLGRILASELEPRAVPLVPAPGVFHHPRTRSRGRDPRVPPVLDGSASAASGGAAGAGERARAARQEGRRLSRILAPGWFVHRSHGGTVRARTHPAQPAWAGCLAARPLKRSTRA